MRGLLALLAVALAGCATTREPEPVPDSPAPPPPAAKPPVRPGAFYKDDGPGDQPPPDLAAIPDAEPRIEPLHRWANRPYVALGRSFEPMTSLQPFRQRGVASWYGRRYHGQKTSIGEIYDMYAMSGAHPTLPLPSYARVTNLANGRSVVVRLNDRGPFLHDRVIDLSYAAAYRLGYVQQGSAQVEVEAVIPGAPAPDPATYLQLGAFSTRQNAEEFRGRVARELAWLTDAVQVIAAGNLWRLHVGPYRSADAARGIAERIEAEMNLKPLLVVR